MQNDSMKELKWLDTKQKKPSVTEVESARKACVADEQDRQTRTAKARAEVKDPSISTDKKVADLILILNLDK